jgi:hypothetical protein
VSLLVLAILVLLTATVRRCNKCDRALLHLSDWTPKLVSKQELGILGQGVGIEGAEVPVLTHRIPHSTCSIADRFGFRKAKIFASAVQVSSYFFGAVLRFPGPTLCNLEIAGK